MYSTFSSLLIVAASSSFGRSLRLRRVAHAINGLISLGGLAISCRRGRLFGETAAPKLAGGTRGAAAFAAQRTVHVVDRPVHLDKIAFAIASGLASRQHVARMHDDLDMGAVD